jgi:succinoglycan biosynthesis protein ExoV
MNMFRFTDRYGSNFGDDLNRWMWQKILNHPIDVQDGTLVLGIGTVIGKSIPPMDKYIVIGSGVGYDAPPRGFGGANWKILSVRGPMTAQALGLPRELAVIDSAVLLRLLPECEPMQDCQREGTVFMPHYESTHTGNWRQVCKIAGIEFLDPREDSEQTVQRIRRAKLVIADAMHAAIVADSLRVPWIPVVTSPQSSTFKWLDWTLSLNLPYRPVALPASTWLESCRRSSFRFYGQKFFLKEPTPQDALRHYRKVRRVESWELTPAVRLQLVHLTWSLPKRIINSGPLKNRKQKEDERRTHRAAESLAKVATLPSYLSDDNNFNEQFNKTRSLLPQLIT